MRKTYLLLLLAPAALVWACGGSDDSVATDGGPDATTDAIPGDSSNDTASGDGNANDGKANDGGSDAAQDVSVTLDCFKPADCFDGGNPDAAYPPDSGEVCCGTVSTSGTFPQCSFNSAATACKAPGSCATNISLSSCTTDTVRLCASDTECTEKGNNITTYNKCCSTAYQDAGRVHFCANALIANASGGAITCP